MKPGPELDRCGDLRFGPHIIPLGKVTYTLVAVLVQCHSGEGNEAWSGTTHFSRKNSFVPGVIPHDKVTKDVSQGFLHLCSSSRTTTQLAPLAHPLRHFTHGHGAWQKAFRSSKPRCRLHSQKLLICYPIVPSACNLAEGNEAWSEAA
jgi:hypothetical protein